MSAFNTPINRSMPEPFVNKPKSNVPLLYRVYIETLKTATSSAVSGLLSALQGASHCYALCRLPSPRTVSSFFILLQVPILVPYVTAVHNNIFIYNIIIIYNIFICNVIIQFSCMLIPVMLNSFVSCWFIFLHMIWLSKS